ncbi:hemolysin transporter protein [Lactobacillus nasalidis]|uniref:Hemolysin transporter protein n=1 Tax=Lactobacillus nasalidis TaxID=2797258 RepID=A0ABQ3W7K7_9LACO|nr:hemolysin family protein [Lactobacillus nasalidis]GHV98495.1 hemolysin transporter protein [Lactobacillus nasalidis]GHV99588.1 hemolysin transporter protein [Lactobacillus nasalidis]GHW01420.1 hemolysin transporter protein [Lactobacillus nasalidis]
MTSDPATGSLFDRLKNHFASNEESGKDELQAEIDQLHASNVLTDTEYSMIEGSMSFHDKVAREVMVPRTDAFMIDIEDDLEENLDDILHQPYSRVPVYRQDKDQIVGVIHIRTILREARKRGFDQLTYDTLISPPLFAPETIELDDLLVQMQTSQQQLAILTDEYGGVTGLASIEDLIEEIVGDIDDEVDKAEILVRQLNDRQFVIYGKMPLTDFNDRFGTDLEMEDVDTLAGYMITKLGVIPGRGEQLEVPLENGMVLTTRRMRGSRLLTVLLTLPEENNEEETEE